VESAVGDVNHISTVIMDHYALKGALPGVVMGRQLSGLCNGGAVGLEEWVIAPDP
jgi:hypothetical protein